MKNVVVIEGEDAAPDTVRATVELIDRLNLGIEWSYPAVGDKGKEQYGIAFPDETRSAIDQSDATLFGASSGASVEALFYLRWGKQTYANVRPAKWMPGCKSPLSDPQGIDFVIVRENLEDLYIGMEGDVEQLASLDLKSFTAGCTTKDLTSGRFALKVITEAGSERVVRFAFELARKRKAQGGCGKVTATSKYNMLFYSDGLFRNKAREVAEQYPDIDFETYIVDDFAHRMVNAPQQFDVVVMPNLYGDILSDAAGGLIGGLGLSASGCYGDEYAYFESAHGTAPDLVGKNIINPTAQILSGAMMLEYLGFAEEGKRLATAVEKVYGEERFLTPDQGGKASTMEFSGAVAERL
ncbi:MAG: isocitrate/isopropylmalate dehydrogenase family protein [Proteobacteria bacterium]|nr:isocitrate/isopropylmalate dehydrogenase family protein [Pseudomonadota bacterium]